MLEAPIKLASSLRRTSGLQRLQSFEGTAQFDKFNSVPKHNSLSHMKTLREFIQELEEFEEASAQLEAANAYVAVREKSGEVVVAANREGLVLIALQLLRLADKSVTGAHYHVGESSIADSADVAIVLVHEKAPWEV
jgi:hypothetical protein